jgi:peptidoglycan/LPS O-acetylase OafA/YrhL
LQKVPAFVITLLEAAVSLSLAFILVTARGYEIVLAIPAFASLVIFLQSGRGALSKIFRLPLFQAMGTISYSIYMLHVPIRNLLLGILEKTGVPSYQTDAGKIMLDIQPWFGDLLLGAFLVILGAAACLSFKYIEEPMRLFGRGPFNKAPKLASAN